MRTTQAHEALLRWLAFGITATLRAAETAHGKRTVLDCIAQHYVEELPSPIVGTKRIRLTTAGRRYVEDHLHGAGNTGH